MKLEFDVASVRQNKSGAPNGNGMSSNVPLGPGNVYEPTGGLLRATNVTLFNYLTFAYKVSDTQFDSLRAAVPEWVLTDRFNIEARTENHEVTKDQMRLMMQALLAERFKLAVHDETRLRSVYALTLEKPGATGPKLRAHSKNAPCTNYSAPSRASGEAQPAEPSLTAADGFPSICGGILGLPADASDRYRIGAANVPMNLIANSLTSWGKLGRPVLDATGLQGMFDFVLEFTPDQPPAPDSEDSAGPAFQQALKQQLGLKLVPQRGEVKILVLDHVEHLIGN